MSKSSSSVRTKHLSSAPSSKRSSSSSTNKGRYLRPVPYATTLALEQFFDGGTMEEHITRRTTSAAKPSPLSPHHKSRRQTSQQSRPPTKTDTRDARKPQAPTRKSESSNDKRRTQQQQFTPVLNTSEREIGKGASLPVVDEKGQVWYDWEEKQEFAPLITVEHERSGWVNFPGATTMTTTTAAAAAATGGRRSGSFSSTSDGESDEGLPSPIRLPLHAVLDAFTFQPAAATPGGGGGAGAGVGVGVSAGAAAAAAVDPKATATDPLHGLHVPPGARPRGKDRRVVRRADSLPALEQDAKADKDAAAREFLDASFDPVKAMLAIQHQQQQASAIAAAAAAATVTGTAADASGAQSKQLVFGKRASMSMKGLKKIFSRKKSTSA